MRKCLLLFFLILGGPLWAQEVLDKVVAVVDNEVILKSELDFQTSLYAQQKNLNPLDEKIRGQILDMMIDEKLLYAQSAIDSVTVTDDQVNSQLDMQMNYFLRQYGSREKLEEVYGMPYDKIKHELREDVRKNLLTETEKNKKFGSLEVTRHEVEDFFEQYKDSLGTVPQKYKIAHIFINPQMGDRIKKKAHDLAQSLLDSLKAGADFARLAKKFSDDPGSASQGGDLGFVKRGVFYPEFEAAAFSLKKGELSGLVESPLGYHIIQLLDRRGDAIHSRHILLKAKGDDEADIRAIQQLSDIRDSIRLGKNSFEFYVRKYSDDKETQRFDGLLGTLEASQIDKGIFEMIEKLKDGEISFPKRLQIDQATYGFHIVKLVAKIDAHKPSLDTDYEDIQKIAKMNKQQKLYKKWMTELRGKIFWEVRL